MVGWVESRLETPLDDAKAYVRTQFDSYNCLVLFIYRAIISNKHVESSINESWRVFCYGVSVSSDSVAPVMAHWAIPSSLQEQQHSGFAKIMTIIPLPICEKKYSKPVW